MKTMKGRTMQKKKVWQSVHVDAEDLSEEENSDRDDEMTMTKR